MIRTCIYGVDLNPLAVELCKVALWLEAHNPGQPLNFLDHHIKCGNAIVGFVRRRNWIKACPMRPSPPCLETTRTSPPSGVTPISRTGKTPARCVSRQPFSSGWTGRLTRWNELSALPEHTPAEIEAKKERFLAFTESSDAFVLEQIAAIPIAQFYIPKTPENNSHLVTDAKFRRYWVDGLTPQGEGTAMALATSNEKRFFHWFLEFPDIIARGGFDCILGNPPYLGRASSAGHTDIHFAAT